MPLPKRLKASDFAADPGGRPGHLLYLPEDAVYSLSAEQFQRLTGEEIPFVPQAIPVQREGTIELQRQLEEARVEIAQLKLQQAPQSVENANAGQ